MTDTLRKIEIMFWIVHSNYFLYLTDMKTIDMSNKEKVYCIRIRLTFPLLSPFL